MPGESALFMLTAEERNDRSRSLLAARLLLAFLVFLLPLGAKPRQADRREIAPRATGLELSRPARPWEFLDAVGTRAGILGSEAGPFEVWVYPLKVLRDFRLRFHVAGRMLPGEALARTVVVRPESSSVLYAGDSFSVRETLFVPPREPGAAILLDFETAEPLEVEASFQRDFQLMWPAGLGGSYMSWNENLRAFALGEEQRKFFALVGSPSAIQPHAEFFTSSALASQSSFTMGRVEKGKARKVIVISASFDGPGEAEKTYLRLSEHAPELLEDAAKYYEQYLGETVSFRLPDPELQQAYDWSRVSLLQGVVSNPFLGTGLIAGYRTSGRDARPGFAWFFGRDALWTSLALIAAGDFTNARTALEFLARYQRPDGKIPHEISQSATFVSWFKDYPYAYASADATPLFLIAMNEYAASSGDIAFAKEKWAELWKAFEFLRSTRDEQGFARNQGVGHGWVEGGPLLPVKTELYQAALGLEATRALANLARLAGREDVRQDLEREFAPQKERLNQAFWIPERKIFAFGLDPENKKIEEASVLATVPMWFRLLDDEKASAAIDRLADADHASDWGMRILSSRSPKFFPAGYHYGSVWPLFTGWAAVGEYRYHRALPAYANLRANALLALNGALGHVTEVLSGSTYEPLSSSSPHQIWSSAMVINPLLRGLLGLEADSTTRRLRFSPHVPAHWDSFEVQTLRLGKAVLHLAYRRTSDAVTLELAREGTGEWTLEFSPALSPRAKVASVEINNRPAAYRVETNAADQHVVVRFPILGGRNSIRILVRDDFALDVPATLPPLGEPSRNLRIAAETWDARHDRLELEVVGPAGSEAEIGITGAAQVASVEGAELGTSPQGERKLRVKFPAESERVFVRRKLTIQFAAAGPGTTQKKDTRP
jgi:glycogen debranching enzyme